MAPDATPASSSPGSEDNPYSHCKPSSSAPCTISGCESSAASSSDNNFDSQKLERLHGCEAGEQRARGNEAYLEYEAGRTGADGFLGLDYDRLNAGGLDDYYERARPPPPAPPAPPVHERYAHPQTSVFLPNLDDVMRLVARYETSEHSKLYPNESDEYQEIMADSERPPGYTHRQSSAFMNRSSLELNRLEHYPAPKTQTTGRRGASYMAKHNYKPRDEPSSFLS